MIYAALGDSRLDQSTADVSWWRTEDGGQGPWRWSADRPRLCLGRSDTRFSVDLEGKQGRGFHGSTVVLAPSARQAPGLVASFSLAFVLRQTWLKQSMWELGELS